MKWLIKRCEKCGGNIYVDEDRFGKYTCCLQCGSTEDYKSKDILKKINELQRV
jgi:hypothetical protein